MEKRKRGREEGSRRGGEEKRKSGRWLGGWWLGGWPLGREEERTVSKADERLPANREVAMLSGTDVTLQQQREVAGVWAAAHLRANGWEYSCCTYNPSDSQHRSFLIYRFITPAYSNHYTLIHT